MKHLLNYSKTLAIVGLFTLLLQSCGSVTNVWDYYVTNEVIVHKQGETTVSKKKLLLRKSESPSKSQLELIAVKQGDASFLVIGSHKIAKSFYVNDSLYSFDVTDIYSSVRGKDFIRQMGDLSIYFTHIPTQKCTEFLNGLETLKKSYSDAVVTKNATTQVDYYFSHNVFASFEKESAKQFPTECILWVGRRKHEISTKELVEALTELKGF